MGDLAATTPRRKLLSEIAASHVSGVEELITENQHLEAEVKQLTFTLHEREARIKSLEETNDDLKHKVSFWQGFGIRIMASMNNVQSIITDCVAAAREAGHESAEANSANDEQVKRLAETFSPQPTNDPTLHELHGVVK